MSNCKQSSLPHQLLGSLEECPEAMQNQMPQEKTEKRAAGRKRFPFEELVGKQFERLTILSFWMGPRSTCMAECLCSCGKRHTCSIYNVMRGATKSCGCLGKEFRGKHLIKHGLRYNPAYKYWKGMMQRCHNDKAQFYNYYGGRGIFVCDRWRFGEGGKSGVACFIDDMGDSIFENCSLERIDNNIGYSKGNCRWATMLEQSRNKTSNEWIHLPGESMILSDFCRIYSIQMDSITRMAKRKNISLLDAACVYRSNKEKRQSRVE